MKKYLAMNGDIPRGKWISFRTINEEIPRGKWKLFGAVNGNIPRGKRVSFRAEMKIIPLENGDYSAR